MSTEVFYVVQREDVKERRYSYYVAEDSPALDYLTDGDPDQPHVFFDIVGGPYADLQKAHNEADRLQRLAEKNRY